MGTGTTASRTAWGAARSQLLTTAKASHGDRRARLKARETRRQHTSLSPTKRDRTRHRHFFKKARQRQQHGSREREVNPETQGGEGQPHKHHV